MNNTNNADDEKKIRICGMDSFSGKSTYSFKPVVKITIDTGAYFNIPTKDIPGFNTRILEIMPCLRQHRCCMEYEGGFLERLKEGTYLPHVIEHMIIALQNMAGDNVSFGRARDIPGTRMSNVIYEFINEKFALECGRASIEIANALINHKKLDFQSVFEELSWVSAQTALGPSTSAIVREAVKRGIPVTITPDNSFVQLGYGKYSRLLEAVITDKVSCISVDTAANKELTKRLLQRMGIPVPDGDIVYTENAAAVAAERLGYPVVVKPYNGNQGKGVSGELTDETMVRKAFEEAAKYSNAVVVEKYAKGKDFRVLVVGDKVAAVAERRQPLVRGDGIHTIAQLIEKENKNKLRGEDHEKPLTKIKIDSNLINALTKQNVDMDYVPEKGRIIKLRENSNLSTGGTAHDRTDETHAEVCKVAVKAAKIVGLDIAGIDITTRDISKPLAETGGVVLEVNAAPGLRMHLYPNTGKPRNVAKDILDYVMPPGENFTIPIVSVTGTNGKTTTVRLISHILSLRGLNVGMTTTSGVFVGGECILKGDNTGPASARMVLSDRRVEAAVLETARGGIVKRGLGYDMADVGIITNISDDHIGLDGINSMDELVWVKSIVAEAVKPEGFVVLNADDPHTYVVSQRVKSKKIYFSRDYRNLISQEKIKRGNMVVYTGEGMIIIRDGKKIVPVIAVADIPITFNARASCNIENSMAAVAAAYALKVPVDIIAKGLAGFKPDIAQNPGRFNMFDLGQFRVMVDYAHNAVGYKAAIEMAKKTDASRLVGVIGVPGDRLDGNIAAVGEFCGSVFDKVYIKEDRDLRGRKQGEVADILRQAAIRGGMSSDNISIILSETEALRAAMRNARPGDLIMIFFEEFKPVVDLINETRKMAMKSSLNTMRVVEQPVS